MKIIKPSFEILNISPANPLELLELAGCVCYKSEDKILPGTALPFVKKILEGHHESVIEHASMTIKFVCDRGVTHELVRHRLCSLSQESTRYCNYNKDKFGNEITVIEPCFWVDDEDERVIENLTANQRFYTIWKDVCQHAEVSYFALLQAGASPQQAHTVLPNSLKTEIVMTANLREWRHVFNLRTSKAAHPQMRELMLMTLEETKKRIPLIFDDIVV
jgi:thymidylate synthase (FAD)